MMGVNQTSIGKVIGKCDAHWISIARGRLSLAQEPTMEGAKAAIEAKKAEWKRHFEGNNMKAVSEIYAVDCKLMPHGHETVHGRQDIPGGLAELRRKGGTSLSWVTTEMGPMTGNGEVLYELCDYKFLRPDGTSVTDGKHVVIWRKTTDGYEMYIDIFNESQ